jgi:restriction system protein
MIQVDEQKIREEVTERKIQLNVHENWLTPSGRERSSPMYETTISNEYLGTSRFLKKQTLSELEAVAREQLEKWAEQEIKAKVKAEKDGIKDQAESDWLKKRSNLEEFHSELRGILAATLEFDDRLDWDSLEDHRKFEKFNFPEAKPAKPTMPERPEKPKKTFLEFLLPSLWRKKLDRHERSLSQWRSMKDELYAGHKREVSAWEARKEAAKKEWETKKAQFERKQVEGNESIRNFRGRYESKDPEAVVEYLNAVFEASEYPEGFSPEHHVAFDPAAETAVVDLSLPDISAVPEESDYKLKKTTAEVTPVPMKPKERERLYEDALHQTVIRTIHEVFEGDYVNAVMQVVLNGWVTYVEAATGQEKTSCIVSVSIDRESFEMFHLDRLDPLECIKSMKGVMAGPLSSIQPVKPILKLDKNDKRFVESEDVLADINSTTNLAEIGWEEFEHLVRELFSKLFSGNSSDVRVTQASSDGGIDAIAFDEDPIRGGKFVIQAKRYTKVVPVSAVRDLYGTMISEGATKGILVTTAHYGRDSRAFVKDKPITLIDGSNLVYLLEEHGHKVRIDVKAARAKRIT